MHASPHLIGHQPNLPNHKTNPWLRKLAQLAGAWKSGRLRWCRAVPSALGHHCFLLCRLFVTMTKVCPGFTTGQVLFSALHPTSFQSQQQSSTAGACILVPISQLRKLRVRKGLGNLPKVRPGSRTAELGFESWLMGSRDHGNYTEVAAWLAIPYPPCHGCTSCNVFIGPPSLQATTQVLFPDTFLKCHTEVIALSPHLGHTHRWGDSPMGFPWWTQHTIMLRSHALRILFFFLTMPHSL